MLDKKSDRMAALVVFFSRQMEKMRRRERDERVVTSSSANPISALLPAVLPRRQTNARGRVSAAETDEVLPSGLRFSYHLRRLIVRRAMLFCLAVSLACVLALPVLSSFRVQTVSVSGHSVYTESDIRDYAGVAVGDELLSCDEDAIRARLLSACPYLKDVRVRRGAGGVSIELTECVPCYAWVLEDGRAALMDETRYVAELCAASEVPDGLCIVRLPLPTFEVENEEGELEQRLQALVAGEPLGSTNAELLLLDELWAAVGEVSLGADVASIDLQDRYDVRLTLGDGTEIALHSATQPQRRLRAVASSLDVYFATHELPTDKETLTVDVDESFRVSLRLVPKN